MLPLCVCVRALATALSGRKATPRHAHTRRERVHPLGLHGTQSKGDRRDKRPCVRDSRMHPSRSPVRPTRVSSPPHTARRHLRRLLAHAARASLSHCTRVTLRAVILYQYTVPSRQYTHGPSSPSKSSCVAPAARTGAPGVERASLSDKRRGESHRRQLAIDRVALLVAPAA